MLLAFIPLAYAWVGVAGDCTTGDYNGTLVDVLRQADREDHVDLVICGEWTLPWGESIDVDEFRMSGGTIWAEKPTYLKIEAERIEINGISFKNVYLILKGNDVTVRDVNMDVEGFYCLKTVARTAEINNVMLSNCQQGIVGDVNELFLADIFVKNVKDATDIDVQEIHIFPVKELVVVERTVEVNKECPPPGEEVCDISPYVKKILELERENERLLNSLFDAQNRAEEYRQELEGIKEHMRKGEEPIDLSWLAALFAVGLGIGYLLGRT